MSASGRANESATNTPAETHYGDSSDSKAKSKSIGDRCDKSVHATLPADCKMTGARQSNATSSTQGASGGPAGSASGAGASGSAAGSGAGASGSGGSSK